MLFVPPSMPTTEAQDPPYFGAIIELDKIYYSWTDKIFITVVAPNFNLDPEKWDSIGNTEDSRITIIIADGEDLSSHLDFYRLTETDSDTGVFTGMIYLTGFSLDVDADGKADPIMLDGEGRIITGRTGSITGNPTDAGDYSGIMRAMPGETITVVFSNKYCSEYGGNVCTGQTNIHHSTHDVDGDGKLDPATITFWVAELGLDSGVTASKQPVTVTVVDPDMNLDQYNRDSLIVDVYSDSDPFGFQLLLTETETPSPTRTQDRFYDNSRPVYDSGIFEGQFYSVPVDPLGIIPIAPLSSPAGIFAKPGDTITVLYLDCTLPQPFSLGDCIEVTETAVVGTSIDGTTSSSVKPSEISTKLILDPLPTTISPEYNAAIHSDSGAEITFSGKLQSADEKFNITYAEIKLMFKGITFEGKDHPCYGDDFCKFTVKTDDNGVFKQQLLIPVGKNMMVYAVYDGWTGEDGTAGPSESQIEYFTVIPGPQTGTPEWYDRAPEPVTAIPEWIKNNAGWWADGQIDDSSFLQGIQFLIKEGIMVIPPTETSGSSDSQGVPAWVKNNAGWWADGQIDDNSFVSGIQYLVKAGIIQVG